MVQCNTQKIIQNTWIKDEEEENFKQICLLLLTTVKHLYLLFEILVLFIYLFYFNWSVSFLLLCLRTNKTSQRTMTKMKKEWRKPVVQYLPVKFWFRSDNGFRMNFILKIYYYFTFHFLLIYFLLHARIEVLLPS